jgi:drug/metabolite transporter (DMT)-like permease
VPEPASGRLTARPTLLLVILTLCWGLGWPATRVALDEVTPWTLRLVGYIVGAISLFALVGFRRGDAALAAGTARLHVVVSALLTILAFGLFGSFAQLNGLTSRIVIVAYSMPVWASLLAWIVLGERLNTRTTIALALAVVGLTVLTYPLATEGVPLDVLLALGSAISWAVGTIYVQWARIKGDATTTAWQLAVCVIVTAACVAIFEGVPHVWPLSLPGLLALAFHGLVGTAAAYLLWFDVVGRLPAATASLGLLSVPVVSMLGSVLLLGERPTAADAVGFALIFAAAACVLLPHSGRKK